LPTVAAWLPTATARLPLATISLPVPIEQVAQLLPGGAMKVKVFTAVDMQLAKQIDAIAHEIGGTRADALRLIISRGLSSAAHPSINEMLRLILKETVYADYYLRAICDLKSLEKVPKGREIRADAEEEFARLLGGANEEKAE
jgi:hypothetical protein